MENLNLLNTIQFLISILILLVIYYLVNIGNRYLPEEHRLNLSKPRIVKILSIVISILAILYFFYRFPIFLNIIKSFIGAVVLAYVIIPFVKVFEDRGLTKQKSTLLVYAIILIFLSILIGNLVPMIINETQKLIRALPGIIKSLENSVYELASLISSDTFRVEQILVELNDEFQKILQESQYSIGRIVENIANTDFNFLSGFLGIILVPAIAFYLIQNKNMILARIKQLTPEEHEDFILPLATDINQLLSGFVRGKLLMNLIVGFMTAVMLVILRVDYAILIGIVTAVAEIIPYVGPFIALTPAVIVAALDSPLKALIVLVLFVVIQWIGNNIISPKVLGQSTGLHPVVTLVALLVGGELAGFIGMIFAVPIVGTLKVIFSHLWPYIKNYFKKS